MAQTDIEDRLRQRIVLDKENVGNEIKEQVLKEMSNIETYECQIKLEIEELVAKIKNEADKKGNDLISTLHQKCEDYRQFLQNIADKISTSESRIKDAIDKGFKDVDLNKQVTLFLNMKLRDAAFKEFQKNQIRLKPKFASVAEDSRKIELGNLEIGREATQIDQSTETSSDELRTEYPEKIDLSTHKSSSVTKIIPVDDENAYVLIGRILFKLEGSTVNKVDGTKQLQIDDFAVLGDGSIILLKKEMGVIKRLYKQEILNFTDSSNIIPQCVCVSSDNHVFICFIKINLDTKAHMMVLGKFDCNGILKDRFDFNYEQYFNASKMTASLNNSDIFILFHSKFFGPGLPYMLAHICKVEQMIKLFGKRFCGVRGLDSSDSFKSLGLCTNENGKLLVSDQEYHSVLLLNERLDFVKLALTAYDGLKKPGPIALLNNILWVADKDFIWKFKYNKT